MNKKLSMEMLENPKLLTKFMENSYWIKELNRHPDSFKIFQKEMKIKYKERATDKLNFAIDNIDMISSIIDTLR